MIGARALALFEMALAQPTDARAAFLRGEIGDDAALAAEIDALLAAHRDSSGFLEAPLEPFLPHMLGPWRLLRLLGAGGMGRVYLAERGDQAYEHQVAVKVLASSLADADSIRRAEAERSFLAWLDHPNIARILDGGSTAEGQPYVVMEYVDGLPIDSYCRSHALDLRARVALFLQVLAAVDAAHRALVVHRDIKPANILVSREGQAKLLDFGIAKSLDGRIRGAGTIDARGPLTPDYASPEQLAGRPLTTACDVYSLGVVLHELLTGRRAHERGERTLAQYESDIVQRPPSTPSSLLDGEALAVAPAALRDWRRHLQGDIDRVLLKALDADPLRRYGSARAFADDLERWRDGLPVQARAGGAAYRLRKFAARNRLAVASSIAIVLALALGLLLAAQQAREARAQAERAELANRFLIDMISDADLMVSGRPPSLLDTLDKAAPTIAARLRRQPRLEGEVRLALGRVYLSLEKLDAAREQLVDAERLLRADGGTPHLDAILQLANLDWWAGRYAEAESKIERAIAGLEAIGGNAVMRAGAMNTLAALLNDVGRFDDALAITARIQHLVDAGAVIGGRETANLLGNIGYAEHGRQRLEASITAYQAALRQFVQVLPAVHPDIAMIHNNLALALQDAGRMDEARAHFEQSLAQRRGFAGPTSSLTVAAEGNMAVFLAENGHPEDARALMRSALANAPIAWGPDRVGLADTYSAAARMALALREPLDAIDASQKAIALYEAAENVDPKYPRDARRTLQEAKQMRDGAAPVAPATQNAPAVGPTD